MTTPALQPSLQLQIPNNSNNRGHTFNLSSVSPQDDIYSSFPSPETLYEQYSLSAGLAPASPASSEVVSGPYGGNIVQPWSQTSRSTSATVSSPPKSATKSRSSSAAPPPQHYATQSLHMGVWSAIGGALPHWRATNPSPPVNTAEDMEIDYDSYLRFDSPAPTPANTRAELLMRFNRILHAPRALLTRKLAGKWDDEMTVHTRESIRSAPSIVCS
jgi:hypothetical protein